MPKLNKAQNKRFDEKFLNKDSFAPVPFKVEVTGKLPRLFKQHLADELQRQREKIDDLIAEEIVIAHREGQPTSRLTSLSVKIDKIK